MKKNRIFLAVNALLILTLLVACQKDEKSAIGISMKATGVSATDPPSMQARPDPDDMEPINDEHLNLSWEEAWINITELELHAERVPAPSGEVNGSPFIDISWNGDQRVDLLGEPRIFANLELKDGQYRDIQLQLTSARRNDNGEANFYLSGRYGPVIGGTPVVVEVTREFSISMRSEEGTVHAGSHDFFNGMVEIYLENVFSGITASDLDKAVLDDGVIYISSDQNQDLYIKILANLQAKNAQGRPGPVTWGFHLRP